VLAAAQGRHPLNVSWPASRDAFDLWIALMTGATLTLSEGIAAAA
jgi:hypothetical protein